MSRVLVAALVALIISILAGPVFIDFLRRRALGQQIREEGPEHHSAKQGTPTMGGVLIVVAASIAFLATSARTLPAMAVTVYIRSGVSGNRIPTRLDAAFIGAAVIGAAIGFLWFNAWPAEIFMGDTGSMAMGGAIGALAIFLKVELLLLLVGGIFVIEALSVMLQVVSFKWWGRRLFLMAPLHHHFEMKAWSETKIMVRFWIVTGILCAAGFALFYRYFRGFR